MPTIIDAATGKTPQTAVRIRPFTPDDYEAIIAIESLNFPDYGNTVEEWRRNDENRPEHIRSGRLIAEDDGVIVGFASYGQPLDMYHPRKFRVNFSVHPERQGSGIGSALYDALQETLAPFDPLVLRAQAQEGKDHAIKFLMHRGFVEEMRDFESRLNVPAFDPAPFSGAIEKVLAQGITIKTLAELAGDPDRDQKLYEMDWTITLDMPSPDTLTKPAFEHWKKNVLENPNLIPEAWFIALDGDKYVGESVLWRNKGDDDLYTGATGVLREYRRRGIALALKLHALAYAKSVDCPRVKTWNCTINRPMLSINEALGFTKEPAWIAFANVLRPEEEAE